MSSTWALLVLGAASGARGAASRLAGRWHGFEQRFHATTGRPLPVPDEYTPKSDLEWGTTPFGFRAELELAPAGAGELAGEHVRQLLWSGCFIEGPSQTTERWDSSRAAPCALADGCWAASEGVSFAALPLPYRAPLRLAELCDEPVHLAELALLAADGTDTLCFLQLAHGRNGRFLVPIIASFFARTPADGAALASRLGDEARRRAEGADAPVSRAGAAGALHLDLADGLALALQPSAEPASSSTDPVAVSDTGGGGSPAPASAFVLTASWRGAGMRVEWRDGRICGVASASLQGSAPGELR